MFSLYLLIGSLFVGFGLARGSFDAEAPPLGQVLELFVVLMFWPLIVYIIIEEFW